ncbi:MAG: hypothetical protein ACLVFA_09790 [Butyricicoccus sp.]
MNDTVYGDSAGLDYIKYTVSNDWNALPQFTLSHPTIKPVMKYFSLHKIMAGGDSFAIGFSSHRVSGGMHGFGFMLCARTA